MLTKDTITVAELRSMKDASDDLGRSARIMGDTPHEYAFDEALLRAAYVWKCMEPLLGVDIKALEEKVRKSLGD